VQTTRDFAARDRANQAAGVFAGDDIDGHGCDDKRFARSPPRPTIQTTEASCFTTW
jgi:hypothetical protein